MKGITPVIATILLLLVTITMVGFAFVWFTKVSESLGNQTATQVEQQSRQQATKARIDNLDKENDIIYIKNSGYVILLANEVMLYINGTKKAACSGLTDLTPGTTGTCTSSVDLATCTSVKITTIGIGDTFLC